MVKMGTSSQLTSWDWHNYTFCIQQIYMYSLQFKCENFKLLSICIINKSETGIYKLLVQSRLTRLSLRGRRLKANGRGFLGAREKRGARFSHA